MYIRKNTCSSLNSPTPNPHPRHFVFWYTCSIHFLRGNCTCEGKVVVSSLLVVFTSKWMQIAIYICQHLVIFHVYNCHQEVLHLCVFLTLTFINHISTAGRSFRRSEKQME